MDNAGNGDGYERETTQDLDIMKKPEGMCPGSIVKYSDT